MGVGILGILIDSHLYPQTRPDGADGLSYRRDESNTDCESDQANQLFKTLGIMWISWAITVIKW